MTTPAILIWLVVLAVGLFAAWRNPTALALVISWAAGEYVCLSTGGNLPLWFYPYADVAVIAVIMAKTERSIADRVVLLIFPALWCAYAAPMHDFYRWFALYYLVLAQFFAVAWDLILSKFRRSRAPSDMPGAPPGGQFRRLAWGRGYG